MKDDEILSHIDALVDEERTLQSKTEHPLSDAEEERQRQIEVALDQCWDLLRQRRARRQYGDDPDEAAIRPPDIVEHYQQ